MNDGAMSLLLLLGGSVFFPLVYATIKFILTRYFKHKLTIGDIYVMSEKLTCSVQAILSVVCGAVIVSKVNDIMLDTHWLANSYAWFGIPYFVHDVRAMYLTFLHTVGHKRTSLPPRDKALRLFIRDSPLLLAHHLIMPAIIFPVLIFLRHNKGDFFVGMFYMIELTIPFISARAILAQLKLQRTVYYPVSGVLMLVSFFLVRVLVFPYLYWRYAVHAAMTLLEVPLRIPVKCNLGCLLVFLPQLYWFWLMLRGVVVFFYNNYFGGKKTKTHVK